MQLTNANVGYATQTLGAGPKGETGASHKFAASRGGRLRRPVEWKKFRCRPCYSQPGWTTDPISKGSRRASMVDVSVLPICDGFEACAAKMQRG